MIIQTTLFPFLPSLPRWPRPPSAFLQQTVLFRHLPRFAHLSHSPSHSVSLPHKTYLSPLQSLSLFTSRYLSLSIHVRPKERMTTMALSGNKRQRDEMRRFRNTRAPIVDSPNDRLLGVCGRGNVELRRHFECSPASSRCVCGTTRFLRLWASRSPLRWMSRRQIGQRWTCVEPVPLMGYFSLLSH